MACPDKEVDSGGVIRRRQLWSMLALLGTIGCASELPDGAQNVAIVSDLDPTGEVVLYRVRVLAGQEQLRAGRHVADPMLDYAAGVDVFEAEFTLPAGFVAEGEAVNASGGIVGRARAFGISPQGRARLVFSRRCIDENCIEGCFAGQCIERCPAGGCPSECVVPEDCPASPACVAVACVDGQCLHLRDHGACPPGEHCDANAGCSSGPPTCDLTPCEDGNPCTVARCDGDRCIASPQEGAACDDGIFCNGDDFCTRGSCTQHRNAPCDGDCNEAERSCAGCTGDGDCGEVSTGPWSPCQAADPCAETGTQTRVRRIPTCTAGGCEVLEEMEEQSCPITTEGNRCGPSDATAIGACEAAPCATRGTQQWQVVDHVCRRGTCVEESGHESRSCIRGNQDGNVCGDAAERCCGGRCVDIATDARNCGGCGLSCGALTCLPFTSGGEPRGACGECSANSQCPGDNATCWAMSIGGSGQCQCQRDSDCGLGQRCFDGAGDNYCFYP